MKGRTKAIIGAALFVFFTINNFELYTGGVKSGGCGEMCVITHMFFAALFIVLHVLSVKLIVSGLRKRKIDNATTGVAPQ
jgi:hypothetical protein